MTEARAATEMCFSTNQATEEVTFASPQAIDL